MLDDDQYIEAKRQIRAQAESDAAAWLESLGQTEDTGIPPPVQIRVTEVSSDPVQFQPFAFGGEQAGTSPAQPQPPPPQAEWACCKPDDSCEDLTSSDCADAGGTWHLGIHCADNPDFCTPSCPACPSDSDTVTVEFSGITSCGCVIIHTVDSTRSTMLSGGAGTFALSPLGGGAWELIDTTTSWAQVDSWLNTTCNGSPPFTDLNSNIHIVLTCSDGIWGLSLRYKVSGGSDDQFQSFVFSGVCVGNGDTVDNQNSCGFFSNTCLETGGTAQISW